MKAAWGRTGPRLGWGRSTSCSLHVRYEHGLLDTQLGVFYLIVVIRSGL